MAGWADNGVNQPGVSASAAASAIRARPAGVACAWAAAVSAIPRLACGLVMFTTCSPLAGASNCWKANAESSAVFQVATPPDSTPHIGSAAVNRLGYRWVSPAVMMPPSEWPHAIVWLGRP